MPFINSPSLYRQIKLGLIKVSRASPTKHRFWAKVDKLGPIHPICGRCWEWTASTINGYGRFGVNYSLIFAHRYSWEIHNGKIPDGLHVLHFCDNPLCVNPKHLFVGTQQDNVNNCIGKERQTRGEAHGMSKLTTEDVLEIRRLGKTTKLSQRKLAIMFDVDQATIGRIILRKLWKHI